MFQENFKKKFKGHFRMFQWSFVAWIHHSFPGRRRACSYFWDILSWRLFPKLVLFFFLSFSLTIPYKNGHPPSQCFDTFSKRLKKGNFKYSHADISEAYHLFWVSICLNTTMFIETQWVFSKFERSAQNFENYWKLARLDDLQSKARFFIDFPLLINIRAQYVWTTQVSKSHII